MGLRDAPLVHVGVASLHVVFGHLGAALTYRARFRRSPLVVYRADASPHRSWSRAAGGLAAIWGGLLIASAWSTSWATNPAGRALFVAPAALAWSIALAGLALMCAAQLSMGAAFRIGQDERDAPSALRRGGLHGRCRNPIYVGSWLALVGMTLWHPSPALLLVLATIGVVMHQLVLVEEVFLRARFGDAFDAYCAVTPRYGVRIR